MSRPAKPNHLTVLSGTDQPCRKRKVPEFEPVTAAPPHANYDANKLLSEADLSTLGMLCALHGKIVQLYAAGETPTASMASTLRAMPSDFGLSAAARGKVSADLNGKKVQNKFANHGKHGQRTLL